jgi:hypothetical protein
MTLKHMFLFLARVESFYVVLQGFIMKANARSSGGNGANGIIPAGLRDG